MTTASVSMPTLPPGPKSIIPFRYLRTLQRDPIPFFSRVASDYGDAAQFFVGPQQIFLFNHPELIRELLVTQHRAFHKSRVLQRSKVIFGEGLLTSEEELHKRQRRLVQPAFHRERISRYAEVMIDRAARLCERWRDGEVLDVHHEMMGLTLSVVAKTLFDADVDREADEIGVALNSLVDLFPTLMNPLSNLLRRLPLPQTIRFRKSIARLDRTVYAIIDERRRSGEDRGDLLSMLLMAVDEEGDGSGMDDRQLRDEAMTLFLAGHETTANALAWTWYLLSQNPAALGELHRELGKVLGDRMPSPEDYVRLPYTEMVVAESMRLFPPAWAVSRLAVEETMIGDWLVPRGAVVVAAQAVTHRDPRWWLEPDRFDPSRFTPEGKASRPKLAYFPFGAGPRVCIGEGFAWMEAVLIMATLAQRWRLELVSRDVTAQASITLRPKGGIRMRLHRR
ncbi:MAG TPA: cytochrome P450 [Thermoanaerobaculia bacterium]|nr:cytochrome P450 [Thermoanaerobaculia bacterium]